MSAKNQIEKLAKYIMKYYPNEITGGGAGDVAIKILEKMRNDKTSDKYMEGYHQGKIDAQVID